MIKITWKEKHDAKLRNTINKSMTNAKVKKTVELNSTEGKWQMHYSKQSRDKNTNNDSITEEWQHKQKQILHAIDAIV